MDQNISTQSGQISSGNLFVRRLGTFLAALVFLLPIFFMPAQSVNIYVAKIILLATSLVVIFAIYLSSVLATGNIEIPKAKYLLPITLFGMVALVSSIFTGNIAHSIAGDVFDLGTSGSILMLVFSLLITAVAVRSVGVVHKALNALVYSSIVLVVYTLFAALLGKSLPESLSLKLPFFLVGGVIDLSIVLGASVIASICALNMSELSRRMKYILYVFMVFALTYISAANFIPVIIILGLVSLVFFVYILSWSVGKKPDSENSVDQSTFSNSESAVFRPSRQISFSSLIVFIFSVLLLLGGTNISTYTSKFIGVQTAEIRPNFESTMNLTLTSWKQNFALGIGPNNFAKFWSLHKPVEINQTQFWNAEFFSGSGFIPTIAITTGLLGLITLAVFIAMYALIGVKAMYAQANSSRSRYLSTASFLVSMYLWIILFLYNPSITVLALAFIFTGLFTVTLVPQGIISSWKVNIFSNPKTNFLSVLSTVVLLALSVAGGYLVWERGIASVMFQKGFVDFQKKNDLALVKQSTARAITMVPSDIYWRGFTELSVADLTNVLGTISNPNQIPEATREKIQALVVDSVNSAKNATQVNPTNFLNWFTLGRVYEILASNGIEGSLENARSSYTEASKLAPSNPAIPLALARLDMMSNKLSEAKANVNKAIALKANYTDAFYTLAQIEAATDNAQGAIKAVEAAVFLNPTNTGLLFQLGVMKYNTQDYSGAKDALAKAVIIVPDYANARYFLALSLEKLGDKEGAIRELKEIQKTNPDNADIVQMIQNLESGKPALPQVVPTKDIEKNTTAPIKEDR